MDSYDYRSSAKILPWHEAQSGAFERAKNAIKSPVKVSGGVVRVGAVEIVFLHAFRESPKAFEFKAPSLATVDQNEFLTLSNQMQDAVTLVRKFLMYLNREGNFEYGLLKY